MLFPKTSNPLPPPPPPLLLPIPKDCCLLEDAVEGKGDENISPTDSDAREEEEDDDDKEEEDEAVEGAEDAPKTPNKSFESLFECDSTACDVIVVDAAAVTGALLPDAFCCCAKGLCAAPPPPPDVDAELAVKAGADATLLLASFDPRLIRDTFKIILFPNAGIISSG